MNEFTNVKQVAEYLDLNEKKVQIAGSLTIQQRKASPQRLLKAKVLPQKVSLNEQQILASMPNMKKMI